MTKKELIEALDPFDDDIEIVTPNRYSNCISVKYKYISIEEVEDEEGETCLSID